jgi:hypothetical protein
MKIIREKSTKKVAVIFDNDDAEVILSSDSLSGQITRVDINTNDFELIENVASLYFNPVFGDLKYDKNKFSVLNQESYDLAKLDYENSLIVSQSASVRSARNQLLKDSDWTQIADVPVNKDAWAIYRQELRDITTQKGFPFTIVWPTQPQGK